MTDNQKTLTQDQSTAASVTPTRPPRLGNLQAFLIRENVSWVMAWGKVKRMTLEIEFVGDETDVRQFDVGGVGSFALMFLTDDPHKVGARVVDIRPPQEESK